MGRKSSRSRVEEAKAAAADAREHEDAPDGTVQVQVGGDASALASMFALSGSVFGKKASYAGVADESKAKKSDLKAQKVAKVQMESKITSKAQKGEVKAQKEAKKEPRAAAEESKAPKKLKKKEKKRLQQAAEEESAAAAGEDKAAAKKQKKKDKKKQKKEQAQAEQGDDKPTASKQTEASAGKEKAVEASATPDDEAAKKQKKRDKKKQKKLLAKQAASERTEQAETAPAEKVKAKNPKEVVTQTVREKTSEDEAKSLRTIFVGNVSLEATEKDVMRHFSPCGKVESVRLRNMPVAGCKVGQAGNQKLVMKVCANKKIFTEKGETCNAYVVFASEASIPAALALNGSTLLSKKLRVDRESLVIDPKRSVFVGGIAFQLPDDQLRAFFSARLRTDEEPEPVEHVRIIRDRETGVGKGFGYVLLKTQSLAAKALSLNETKLGTREIRVQVSGKRFKNRRGEDINEKHEGLRSAAGARGRIQLKRKTRQGSEVTPSKRQKLEEAVKTIKPKHAARKARQAAEAGKGVKDFKGAKGAKDAKDAKGVKGAKSNAGKHKHKSDRSSKKPKVKVQKPKHAARKARQAAEAAATAATSS